MADGNGLDGRSRDKDGDGNGGEMNPSKEGPVRLGYRRLEAWKVSRELAIRLVKLTSGPGMRPFRGLADQMQRSAVSVPSNIAEGEERGTNKDALRFLYIAKGSLAELRTQMDISRACGGLSDEEFEPLDQMAVHATALIAGLVRTRRAFESVSDKDAS